jgi:ERF superfamily
VPAQDTPTPAIYAAIWAVMKQVRAIPKNGNFSQGQTRYKFRAYDDIAVELGDAVREHGIFVQTEILAVEKDLTKKTSSGNVMVTTNVRVRFTLTSLVDGSTVTVDAPGESADSSDKSTAKAMTMAMKTAMTTGFLLPTGEKDPDAERPGDFAPPVGQGQQRPAPPVSTTPPAAPKQRSAEQRREYAEWCLSESNKAGITLGRVNDLIDHAKARGMLGYEHEGAALRVHLASVGMTLGQDMSVERPEDDGR